MSSQVEAIVFIIHQIFFSTRAKIWLGYLSADVICYLREKHYSLVCYILISGIPQF